MIAILAAALSPNASVIAQNAGVNSTSLQATSRDESFKALWHAVCNSQESDMKFVREKLASSPENKIEFDRWAEKLGNSPNDDMPAMSPPANPSSNKPNAKKSNLNQAEIIALYQMFATTKKSLAAAFNQYFSADAQASKAGREKLVELAGPEAVANLDRTVETSKATAMPTVSK